MTRFIWLQSRLQALVILAALAALAVVAALTGVHLSHQLDTLLATCQSGCDLAVNKLLDHDSFLQHALDLVALVLPALLGIFWGAPLIARELESGTYRLAWTQGVTRRRWLLIKLGVGALATVVVAGVYSLTITWWYRLFDHYDTSQYAVFDRRGIVPIGYALFAFAIGAFAGAVIRRTVPAMATTIGAYVAARVGATWLRPHLLSPLHETASMLTSERFGFIKSAGSGITLDARGSGPPGSWTIASHIADVSGHRASPAELSAFVTQHCPNILPPPPPQGGGHIAFKAVDPTQFDACRTQASHVYHFVISYQPGNRDWTFQWLELGIFSVLALVAAGACYWWVTRRAT